MPDHSKISQKIEESDQKLRWEEYFRLFVKTGHISPFNLQEGIHLVNETLDLIDFNFTNRIEKEER